MSDYLQNIVLRSLGLAEVVQPRVPQLFEQALASAPLPDSYSQTQIEPTTPVISDAVPEMTQTTHREIGSSAIEDTETSTLVTETSNRNHHLPFTVRPAGPSPVVKDDPPRATLIPSVTTLDSGSPANPLSTPRASSETQPQSQRETSVVSNEPLDPSITMSTRNAPGHSNARLQSSVPKQSLPSLAQNLRAQPQPLPVKITIGRVDVRAIMPSGPPKVAGWVRPKPALSLESYLKQREEGKR